jgi:hypothetical protein
MNIEAMFDVFSKYWPMSVVIYTPNDLEMQDCACPEVTEFKGLRIERLRLLGQAAVFEDATLLDPRS